MPAPGRFAIRLAKEENELKKKLLLVGYLSSRLSEKGGKIFLVGGQAVETYTGGVFTTGDVDITTTNYEATEEALSALGFTKIGMIWVNARLGIAVHLVASYPTRSEKARTIEVDGFSVRVVGVEDLIVDRLSAAKFWKSDRDMEQAKALLETFRSSIDFEYLRTTAEKKGIGDSLERASSKRGRRRETPE